MNKGRDSGSVNNRAESSTKNPQTEEVRIKVEDDVNEVVPSAQKKRKIEVFDDFIDLTRDAETSTRRTKKMRIEVIDDVIDLTDDAEISTHRTKKIKIELDDTNFIDLTKDEG